MSENVENTIAILCIRMKIPRESRYHFIYPSTMSQHKVKSGLFCFVIALSNYVCIGHRYCCLCLEETKLASQRSIELMETGAVSIVSIDQSHAHEYILDSFVG